jgi:hypothetical protein
VSNDKYAIYVANLIHRDSRSVVKVVRYGHKLLYLPDAHTVELCERQITRQKQQEQERPFSLE